MIFSLGSTVEWFRRHWLLLVVGPVVVGVLVWGFAAAFESIDRREIEREEAEVRVRVLTRQALVLERDLTALRLRAEQTADCPVLYLRSLLAESARPEGQRDLSAVAIPPHCQANGIDELSQRLAEVEAEIALHELRRQSLREQWISLFPELED